MDNCIICKIKTVVRIVFIHKWWSFVKDYHRVHSVLASQITSLIIVHSTVYSDADQWKHQCSASLAFVQGIHRGPVNSPHKWPVTRKMFPFDDVIMYAMYFSSHIPHAWTVSKNFNRYVIIITDIPYAIYIYMVRSWHGNAFYITGPIRWKSTSDRRPCRKSVLRTYGVLHDVSLNNLLNTLSNCCRRHDWCPCNFIGMR